MNNLVPIEFKKQRIMTTSVIAESYGTTTDHIKKNFNNNKDKYKEGKHYFLLQGEELKEFLQSSNLGIQNPSKVRSLYLWTEKGALLHAKSLNTDKAWEVYDILVETYFRIKEVAQAPKQLTALEQLDLQRQAILEVNDKVEALEKDMPLFKAECDELQDLVHKVGVRCLGGKKSKAYNDASLRGRVYADIQHQLKREFGVNKYAWIKHSQFNKAKEIISNYTLPIVLEDEIALINNQLEMEVTNEKETN